MHTINEVCDLIKDVVLKIYMYNSLVEKVKEVNSRKEEGDRLYVEATRRLYSDEKTR